MSELGMDVAGLARSCVVVVAALLAGCGSTSERALERYFVRSLPGAEIIVDGELDEPAWEDTDPETKFSFPWRDFEAPATEFRALTDEGSFYFAFRVEDADVVVDAGDVEEAVARGDRVELFFSADFSLEDYICIEIDPSGRVLDYRAAYYRDFDVEWDLAELVVSARLAETGYVVEGRIPHAAFRDAGLPILSEGGKLLAGIFRAEFSHGEDGTPREEWISWVRPDSEEPDFHIPSAFGWLEAR